MPAHTTTFLLYLLLGPGAWLLYAVAIGLGQFRMSRLKRPAVELPADPPKVVILVPAKDEGERTRVCLDAVLGQDYPNFYFVAIDDRSADNTGKIMDERAAADPRLKVLHIPPGPLPEGWLGKCHALHAGAVHAASNQATADAEWLLFVDSDVDLAKDALSATIGLAISRGYDAVSLFTRQECYSFFERLLVPLAGAAVMTMYLVSVTNDDNRKRNAFANGQFFLIRKAAYDTVGGHASVRDQFTEDVELMRAMKASGFITRLYMGKAFASTRMYSSLRNVCRGWARIYAGCSQGRPWRILAAATFIVISGLSAYVALAAGLTTMSAPWVMASTGHLVLITVIVAIIYRLSDNPSRYAFLFPLGASVLLGIFALGLSWCATGRIEWRGTYYSLSPSRARTT